VTLTLTVSEFTVIRNPDNTFQLQVLKPIVHECVCNTFQLQVLKPVMFKSIRNFICQHFPLHENNGFGTLFIQPYLFQHLTHHLDLAAELRVLALLLPRVGEQVVGVLALGIAGEMIGYRGGIHFLELLALLHDVVHVGDGGRGEFLPTISTRLLLADVLLAAGAAEDVTATRYNQRVARVQFGGFG